jgi:2-haloacid dehalogenase
MARRYQAILFDLLTALIDSWTLWDETAGSVERGRAWRAEYLKLTYGCGAYRPYECLVAEAAESVGLGKQVAERLESNWARLRPWPEARRILTKLSQTHKLGVVTNCSERLGRSAAESVDLPFAVIVTAERAGYYKPHPRPYQLALEAFGVTAAQTLFVSGSAYDLIGTAALGLDTYWHNRVGLTAPEGAPRPMAKRATLSDLPAVANRTT